MKSNTHSTIALIVNTPTDVASPRLLTTDQKKSNRLTSCYCGCLIFLFISIRKEIVNYFKINKFNNNPHLFNLHLSLGVIIFLATIRTLSSTLIKVDYIQHHRRNSKTKKQQSSCFAQLSVWMNGLIAGSAIFIPTYNTFKNYPIICGVMTFYALSSSIYSNINFSKPLINRMADWFFQLLFNPQKRHEACQKLKYTFFKNCRVFKFFITIIGILTSSLFLFYTLEATIELIITLPNRVKHLSAPHYLHNISTGLTIFLILFLFIPRLSAAFREETIEAEAKFSKEYDSSTVGSKKKLTPTIKELYGRCHHNCYLSYIILSIFIILSILCWFACALILSVGTYIGAQHIFGKFACCTTISDIVFIVDFIYQGFYYGTELCRKISDRLMRYVPCSSCLFQFDPCPEETQGYNTPKIGQNNNC